jgi:GABA(A) receptor-associated protein
METRLEESTRILEKYPDRIPILVNKKQGCDIPEMEKKKYLVPRDMTLTQFIFVIRKRLVLEPSKALFFTMNDRMEVGNRKISDIYLEHKEEDGFLYITYSSENTFG